MRHIFLTVMEAGKSKIKVLADFIPDESSLSDLQMAPSCSVSFGREEEELWSLTLRTLIPFMRAPSL